MAPTPSMHPALPKVVAALSLVIVVGAYFVWANYTGHWPYSPSPTGLEYRNNQYGFYIPLPTSWMGYKVLAEQWEGRDVASGQVTEHGPKIVLRNPLWSAANPYEDMPVMVFTYAQWDLVQKEEVSLGAAPIPPSELGRNSKYVMALPARYNYDFATGWEEVDQLVHGLKTFEPGSQTQSGISGTVLVGPTCPVQRINDPACDDKPYQGTFTVKNAGGAQVAQFSTDSSGHFTVFLKPGTYTIMPVQRIGISQQSKTVTVISDTITTVTLTFDTGIR